MAGRNGSEAAAAIGEREMTQGRAVLWTDRRHGLAPSLDLDF
jgi:hypothetical protein